VQSQQPTEPEADAYAEDFELILGRRQVAGVTFLILVILAVFSGGSYVAGKAATPPKIAKPEKPKPAVPEAPAVPVVEATVAPPKAPPETPSESPLFAKPVSKAIYIQMGAVEKGIAVIFAEGLRKRGFDSFVAPGPNEKVFRVLIGPFRDADAYQAAKASLDDIGLSTFARRYEE
jgi:cell division septation protein DedD